MKKQLGMSKIILLALGQVGVIFLMGTVGTYALRFYSPTETTMLPFLVPIGTIGIIQGFSVAFDALIDPWIANVSDNSKNPKGRRIPIMRKAVLPAGLFCVLVFFSPINGESWINLIWVLAVLLLYCFSRSFYDMNLKAIIPEIIPDTFKRGRFFLVAAIFNTVGSLIASTTPVIIEALQDSMSILMAWRMGLMVFPVIGTVLMLLPTLFIRETDYADAAQESEVPTPLFASLKNTFQNKEFVTFMIGAMAFDFSIGIFSASLLFLFDILLGVKDTMLTMIFILLTGFALILYGPILALQKRVGKRKIMLSSICVSALIFVLMYFYRPIGDLLGAGPVAAGGLLANFAGEGAKLGNVVLILIIGTMFAFPQAVGGVIGSSIYADIAQYDNMISGKKRTGMFMAVASIIGTLPSTLVPALVGVLIYLGSKNNMPTVEGVRSTMLVAFLVLILAFIQYFRYSEKKVFDVIIQKEPEEQEA